MLESEIANRFAVYAEGKLRDAGSGTVSRIARIHGGASRQTYSIDLDYDNQTGPQSVALILRRDPPDSLIDTERRIEFAAIKSLEGHRVSPL